MPAPFLTVALVLAPILQADQPGFIMWDTSELKERNSVLATRVGPDDSARETLADYVTPSGSHRFRFIRRDGDGRPEQHDRIDDVVYIQSGEGTLLVGGEMLGRHGRPWCGHYRWFAVSRERRRRTANSGRDSSRLSGAGWRTCYVRARASPGIRWRSRGRAGTSAGPARIRHVAVFGTGRAECGPFDQGGSG